MKRRVSPEYPDVARDQNLGEVDCKVRIFIDEKGIPYDFRFQQCPKIFQSSAKKALAQWRWYPAKFQGQKVKAQFLLNIRYRLR